MLRVIAHEAIRLSEGDQCEKYKTDQKREQDHSPFRFSPLTAHHGRSSTWRNCSFTVDVNAHNDSLGLCGGWQDWGERRVRQRTKKKRVTPKSDIGLILKHLHEAALVLLLGSGKERV